MAGQDTVRHYAAFLAEMGYAAYCFDFNGGSVMKSKSDGQTTEMSVLTEVNDLETVIDYVSTMPYVNKDKIFLMGCSQGGFVSALLLQAVEQKDREAIKSMFSKEAIENIDDIDEKIDLSIETFPKIRIDWVFP